ncbi:hypothetical protein HYFRA_00011706 [Hymenoscyphus fraxineus]|uniref:Uncharacterized protein n=1 Tax=Hymenoscyphus fraxineus TaxID=746836 RepID=A0A9N9PVR0_9HELO|nr:hypothetical protein HYFRA_00011706 [Hymenoscyphus fraxineus]
MQHLSRVVRGIAQSFQLWKRDSTIVPAACYSQCNNAYIDAQKIGKTPALCAKNSTFQVEYLSCQDCVLINSDSDPTAAISITTRFQSFLDYCAQPAQSITSAAITGPTSSITSFSSLPNFTETTTATATVYFTSSPPVTGSVANLQADETNLPSQISNSGTPPISKSHTWVAGAVIGPALVLLSVASFFFIRRRRNRKVRDAQAMRERGGEDDATGYKAQLHGDSVVKVHHELPAEDWPELPAREPVGSELAEERHG